MKNDTFESEAQQSEILETEDGYDGLYDQEGKKIAPKKLQGECITFNRPEENSDGEYMNSDGEIDHDRIRIDKKKQEKSFLEMDVLKHDEMGYQTVKKDFYYESEEVSNMDSEIVKMIR